MAAVAAWARVVFVGSDGVAVSLGAFGGRGRPALADVEALARAQLAAHRLGGCLLLVAPCPELRELLDLVGLGGEVGGQPEGGEQVRVEEGVEPGDPAS